MTEIPRYTVEAGSWAVARLAPLDPVPEWAASPSTFSSITRTPEELSIICPESAVPASVTAERGWAMIKLAGPFAFTEIGILASVLRPLAHAGVSVVAVSTFDTDYILVKRGELGRAMDALETVREERLRRREDRSREEND